MRAMAIQWIKKLEPWTKLHIVFDGRRTSAPWDLVVGWPRGGRFIKAIDLLRDPPYIRSWDPPVTRALARAFRLRPDEIYHFNTLNWYAVFVAEYLNTDRRVVVHAYSVIPQWSIEDNDSSWYFLAPSVRWLAVRNGGTYGLVVIPRGPLPTADPEKLPLKWIDNRRTPDLPTSRWIKSNRASVEWSMRWVIESGEAVIIFALTAGGSSVTTENVKKEGKVIVELGYPARATQETETGRSPCDCPTPLRLHAKDIIWLLAGEKCSAPILNRDASEGKKVTS